MVKRLMDTRDDWAATVIRIALGVMIVTHGAQKLFGWFGGFGVSGTIGFFSDALGVPAVLTVLVIIIEFFGGLALIVGALSRIAAAGVIAVMLGAVYLVHFPNGWFMNWGGNQAGEGFEFHFLVVAMAVALLFNGSGAFSVDRKLTSADRA